MGVQPRYFHWARVSPAVRIHDAHSGASVRTCSIIGGMSRPDSHSLLPSMASIINLQMIVEVLHPRIVVLPTTTRDRVVLHCPSRWKEQPRWPTSSSRSALDGSSLDPNVVISKMTKIIPRLRGNWKRWLDASESDPMETASV